VRGLPNLTPLTDPKAALDREAERVAYPALRRSITASIAQCSQRRQSAVAFSRQSQRPSSRHATVS
jgi:hypothetical protein